MGVIQLWLTYYSLHSILAGVLVFVYQIDKVYKYNLHKENKGYNILKGGIYVKERTKTTTDQSSLSVGSRWFYIIRRTVRSFKSYG
jgi:predicted membrane protein